MAATAHLAIAITAQNQAQAALKSMQGTLKDMGNSAKTLSAQMKSVGSTMTSVGTGLTVGLTAPIVGFGASVLKTASDFEQAMANVNAIANGTEADLQSLTAAAQELGRTTSFSASEAAAGMSFLAMAGFETNEIIAAMPGLLNTAAAGATDLATTADIVSNVLSGFNIDASETGRVADILTKTFTSSNTNLVQLGEAMKYAAPVAAAMGVSIEEVATAIGFMSDAGIQASMAGTSVRTTLLSLASPTEQAQKAMTALGISVLDAQGELLSFPEIISALETGLNGLSDAQKAATLEMIVGKPAVAGLLAVMARGPEEFAQFSDGLRNSVGTSSEVAAKQLDTLQGQLKLLASAWEGLQIAIGTTVLPALTQTIERITPAVSAAANAFANLSPQMQQTGIAIAAIVATIGPLAVGLGMVVGAVGNLISLIGALGGAFAALVSPIGLVAAGLGILIAYDVGGIRTGIVELSQSVFEFGSAAVGAMPQIIGFFNALLQSGASSTQALAAIKSLPEPLQRTAEIIRSSLSTIGGAISATLGPALQNLQTSFAQMVSGLSTLSPQFIELGAAMQGVLIALSPAIEAFGTVASAVLAVAVPLAINVLSATIQALPSAFAVAIDQIVATLNLIASTVSGMTTIVTSLLQGDFVGAWEGAKQVIAGFGTFAMETLDTAVNTMGISFGALTTAVTSTMTGIAQMLGMEGLLGAIQFVDNALTGFIEKLTGFSVADSLTPPPWITQLMAWAWPVFTEMPGWVSTLIAWTWPAFIALPAWVGRLFSWVWPSLPSAPAWISNLMNWDWPSLPGPPAWVTNLFGGDGTGTGGAATTTATGNAIGTSNWRGGLTWVGETGPELVALPRGSGIYSNSDSMAMAGGGVNVTVNVASVSNDIDIQRMAYQIADIVQRRRR